MPWAPEANEFGVRTKRFVLSHPRIGIKNARVQRFATGGVRGRRPWAASSGSVPHRVASAGRGEASLDIVLGDDRSRAGRTGPKGEDFGEHGGWGWWIFAGAERCGARGLTHREAGGGAAATGFWIDFGIVLKVYFIAIRTPVIDFSTKIVHDF